MRRSSLAAIVAPGLLLALLAAPSAPRAQGEETIGIVPTVLTLLAGETYQLAATGTVTLPLYWQSTDPAVLQVDHAGVVTAIAPGQARVLVRDGDGRSGVSDLYTVAHLGLAIEGAYVLNSQAPFTVRVTGDLGAWQVSALELAVAYNPDVLEAVGATSVGTLSETWGAPTAGLVGNRLRIAHAGVQPLAGAGALVGAVFRLRTGLESGMSTVLWLTDVRLNEGLPLVKGGSGTIRVRGAPIVVRSVTVSPATAELRPGTLAAFAATVVSGGVGGVAWSVAGSPAHGTIDAEGVYRAPAVLPVPAVATIYATSLEDPAVRGTATVTLLPALEAGPVGLAVLKNPANRFGLQVLVSAADPFLAPPTVTVDGAPATVTAVDGSLSVYRAHVCLPQGTASATIHAAGTTALGAGEAESIIVF